ncbi:hypothetical protein [Hymenobacter frigidus]|nr:hypothetical protein [Hymenobacter frigidus]
MKMLWCWRCQQEIPMLEPEEYLLVGEAKQRGMLFVEAEARRRGKVIAPIQLQGVAQRFQAFLEMYKLLTGFEETNPNAVMHHQVDQYGPPCPNCRKPLRTPAARFCAACGFGQEDIKTDARPLVARRSELF